MAELKTKPTKASVNAFLKAVDPPQRRADCQTLARLMRKVTGKAPKMWGESMVGFGEYHYTYASGHKGSWFATGFAPRKRDLTIYIMPGYNPFPELMEKLGKFRAGKACLYVKRLDDIDLKVLETLIVRSVTLLAEKYF